MRERPELSRRVQRDLEEILQRTGFGEDRMIAIFREAMFSFTVEFIHKGPVFFNFIRAFVSSREAKGAIAGAVIGGVLPYALGLSDSSNYLHWITVGSIAGGMAGNNYPSA